jgi:hypothetical protein
MMRLTDDQLFAYLDGGEDDPFVAEMLKRDENVRERLALIRRVRTQLASVVRPTHHGMRFALNLEPPAHKRVHYSRPPDEFDPLAAFLQGKAERHGLGEIHVPMSPDVGAGRRVLAELHTGRRVVETGLFQVGESPMLWVRIRDRGERPMAGARANLLSPGEAVQRFRTDEEGMFELPVPAGPALLRLELEPTCEIRLVPATDL